MHTSIDMITMNESLTVLLPLALLFVFRLTQFACVYSALIHDLDHEGVPNMVLIQEQSPLAAKYQNKSVAEQNSVDLAWNLLMSSDFDNLRNCICCDDEEYSRFRSLVVNSVMATDVSHIYSQLLALYIEKRISV